MQRALGACLALAIVSRADAASADPSAPQLSPVHIQREDSQRLADHQRSLDRENPPPATMPAGATAPPPVMSGGTDHGKRVAGVVLLGIAGVSAIASFPLLEIGSVDTATGSSDTADTAGKIALGTALIAGVIGISLVVSSRSSVQVVPSVTPKSAGVALVGRM